MLALYITGCLLAAVLLLLLVPVRLRFEYRGNVLKASLRYLFLKFDFFPEEDAKKAAKRAAKAAKRELKKQEKEEEKGPKEPKAALDTLKTVQTIIKSAEWGLKYIFSHIVFYGVKIYISVSKPDAHQTAVSYGRLSALIYPGVQAFREIFVLREPDIVMVPDFLSEKSRYYISFKARLMPLVVVIAIVNALTKYVKSASENKRERKIIKTMNRRRKHGKYKPAASGK